MYTVYVIKCKLNNKVYIGQTNNFKRRLNEHKMALKNNAHYNKYLQDDFNKFGLINFEFNLLEGNLTKQQSLEKETYYINKYGGVESLNVYNETDLNGHNLIYKNNQSEAQKGVHTITEQGKLRISQANKGKTISEHQKQLIRENAKNNENYGMKNKTHTEQSKLKMHNSKIGIYEGTKNPNYRYSTELCIKLREAYKLCPCYAKLGRQFNLQPTTVKYLILRNF